MSGPLPGSPEHSRIVTASKAAAILGLSPWQAPDDVRDVMAGAPGQPTSDQMRRGHYLEPAILAWWRDHRPAPEYDEHAYREQVWFTRDEWAGCTVDALTEWDRETVIVEAKSTASSKGWGKPGTDQVPDYYLVQCLFQLELTGAARCYLPMIGPYLRFAEYVIERDADAQRQVLDACHTFYLSLDHDDLKETA